jgi:hypothetical protein
MDASYVSGIAIFPMLIALFWLPNKDADPQVRRNQIAYGFIGLVALSNLTRGLIIPAPTDWESGSKWMWLVLLLGALIVPSFRKPRAVPPAPGP